MTKAQNQRKVKADFHNHLRTSSRLSDEDFNAAIDIASERLGLGGTFGMINFADKRYEKFTQLIGYKREYVGENRNAIYVPERDVLVVKGQEVPTKQGHLLILGLGWDEHITPYMTLEDTLKQAKEEYNATIIGDHLFFTQAQGAGRYLGENFHLVKDLDAIEVYNGEAAIHPLANFRAQNLFNRIVTYPTGAISTSDGHSLLEIGRNWTEIDEIDRGNPENYLTSLKESVQNTKRAKKMRRGSRIGAVNHVIDLIWILKVAPKIGLGFLYETERPEGVTDMGIPKN